jgi:hypothetical protein
MSQELAGRMGMGESAGETFEVPALRPYCSLDPLRFLAMRFSGSVDNLLRDGQLGRRLIIGLRRIEHANSENYECSSR